MVFKFYIQKEGQTHGPYTISELKRMNLSGDTLISEESMDGEWLPASRFNFEDLLEREQEGGSETGIPEEKHPAGSVPNGQVFPPSGGSSGEKRTPSILRKWNWAAFLLSWVWGLFNGVYWPVVLVLVNMIPNVGWALALAGCIFLGIRGNKLAWNGRKKWQNANEFEIMQRKWSMAALILLGIAIVVEILLLIIGYIMN